MCVIKDFVTDGLVSFFLSFLRCDSQERTLNLYRINNSSKFLLHRELSVVYPGDNAICFAGSLFATIRSMKVLVTGGAGYIGSFMVKRLLDDGHDVVVADSLERGHESSIDKRATLLKGDLLDKVFIDELFSQRSYDCVMHFAAFTSVGE